MPVLKLTGAVAILWLVVASLLPCGGGTGLARLMVLRTGTAELQGRVLSLDELRRSVGNLHVDLGVTRYAPAIEYASPTNWTVRLTPHPARAYQSVLPGWYRVLVLNFHRADYPVIEFSANPGESPRP